MSAPARRELVRQMTTQALSERRALCVMRVRASVYRHATRPGRNVGLRQWIVSLAQRHKRYDVGMIHLKLRQAGLPLNHKLVERLYEEARLQVWRRKRKKVSAGERQPLARPATANEVWWTSYSIARPKAAS